MKNKIILFLTGSVAFIITLSVISFENDAVAYPTGISGQSGGTGSNCSICHSDIAHEIVNASNATLTSDIPTNGYIPGTIYNMVLTIKSKKNRVGFNFRAQNSSNLISGAMSNITNGQVMNNEITHTSSTNTISGGQKQITFKWTAPAKGTGNVTFFGSVGTGVSPGVMDTLNKMQVVFAENSVVTADDDYTNDEKLSIYPTNAQENFTIDYTLSSKTEITVKLYSSNGILIKELFGTTTSGKYTAVVPTHDLNDGTYIVKIADGDKISSRKVFISRNN